MRFWKPATAACIVMMIGLASADATVVTLNDTFYANGFATPQKGAPPAPVDPVVGTFSITFDNSLNAIYKSVTNSQVGGLPSNFTISSNLPGLLSTAVFDYDNSTRQAIIVENIDTTGIPQMALAANQIFITFYPGSASPNTFSYGEEGPYVYNAATVTISAISQSVAEPMSLPTFIGGIFIVVVIIYRRSRPAKASILKVCILARC